MLSIIFANKFFTVKYVARDAPRFSPPPSDFEEACIPSGFFSDAQKGQVLVAWVITSIGIMIFFCLFVDIM